MPEDDRRQYDIEFNRELAASVKSLYDLTTRVDERVEQLISCQKTITSRMELLGDRASELTSRVTVLEKTTNQSDDVTQLVRKVHDLELRTQSIEINSGNVENRWKTIVNFALQLIWVIIAAYLLYKLGIQAPAVP